MRYMCGANTENCLSMRFTPRSPRTQIIGFQGPTTITLIPKILLFGSLDP